MEAFLADLVVAIHLLYVGSVVVAVPLIVLGGLRGWRWVRNAWFRSVHLLMIAVVAVQAVLGITCPLTTWEVELRGAAGQYYEDQISFVGRLVRDILFYEVPQERLTVCYVAFLLLVIGSWVWIRPRPFRPRPGAVAG